MDNCESTRGGGCGERNREDEPHLRCRWKELFCTHCIQAHSCPVSKLLLPVR
jgi:hypothetical protein